MILISGHHASTFTHISLVLPFGRVHLGTSKRGIPREHRPKDCIGRRHVLPVTIDSTPTLGLKRSLPDNRLYAE